MSEFVLLAPASLGTWFGPLGGEPENMRVIGEGGPLGQAEIEAIASASGGLAVCIHSGHDSLLRDSRLAEQLRAQRMTVYSQSETAVSAGVDKVFARTLMQRAGVPLTPWGTTEPTSDEDILVKSRDSTQSRNIAWRNSADRIEPGSYWEKWTRGAEYSANGYRERGKLTMLPLVAKGQTGRDLLPPWRRTRWVNPMNPIDGASAMFAVTRTVVEALDIWGFFEIEFVMGTIPQVIEVNPRISGTLRLAAMAAQLQIFAPGAFRSTPEIIAPVLAGMEVPFQGWPVAEPRCIATSRLTCVGDTLAEVLLKVQSYEPSAAQDFAVKMRP